MVQQGSRPAEAVLLGARVFTGDPARPWAESVAITDGRISAVGGDADVAGHIGPRTDVVELEGQLVCAGMIDAHIHAIKGGAERLQCNLLGLHDRESYREAIRRYCAEHAELEWVTGGGWSMDAFPGGVPTAADLDDVAEGRPVLLYSRDHHTAWVSSRALELAGITRQTPDPWGGRIERDAHGVPVGALQERAMNLVADLLPAPSDEERDAALLEAQRYLHSVGITGWQDAKVLARPDDAATYLRAAERGDLVSHVVGAQWWDPADGMAQLERVLEVRRRGNDVVRLDAVKLMLDGVCENRTAALLDPYCGEEHDRGVSFYEKAELEELVVRLDAEGLLVHFHAIGDAAVRSALDAVAAARRRNPGSRLPHHVAHVQVVHPADVPRFAELGVVANAQPLWARNEPQMTQLTIPVLGPDRSRHQYPFGRIHRAGGMLALGSDWPVSTPDPTAIMHVAVTRLPVPRPGAEAPEVFLPDDRLGLADVLTAYTAGSALVNGTSDTRGRVAVGYRADLVTFDRDLFEDPERVWQAKVQETRVDGKVVYSA
jgi:Predicted metal-dependent hydrolase with the TIM-barrel fold